MGKKRKAQSEPQKQSRSKAKNKKTQYQKPQQNAQQSQQSQQQQQHHELEDEQWPAPPDEFADVPFIPFQHSVLYSARVALDKALVELQNKAATQVPERAHSNFLTGEFSPMSPADLVVERASPVFEVNLTSRARLPAFRERVKLCEFIRHSQVTLIVGATGCGKSTQIPQIILEDAIERGEPCRILISQPRRIAAVSLAERVAWERGSEVGARIAYKIRFEDVASVFSQVVFCTAGLLLKLMHSNPLLQGCTHNIVDEVHERGLQTDFLLLLLRRLLRIRTDLKVILMSATIEPSSFLEYFPTAKLIEIEGSTNFPIRDIFLEDVLPFCLPLPLPVFHSPVSKDACEVDPEKISDLLNCSPEISEWLAAFHQKPAEIVEMSLIQAVLIFIHRNRPEGGILVFVPGIAEIISLQMFLLESEFADELAVFPMHSSLPTLQQKLVFEPAPLGKRKVVVSTSLAETSVTIEDIVYVVDTGKERSIHLNHALVNALRTAWYSKANGAQRRGRAGRCRPGEWYRLYTSLQWAQFPETTLPEMVKLPLEELCLQVSALGFGSPVQFLREALSAPHEAVVRHSLGVLLDLGAVTDAQGTKLTPLGEKLSRLHVHPTLGKMLLLSALFRCVQPITVICAVLGYKSPFLAPLQQGKECAQFKRELSAGSLSDHITVVNAYHKWCHSELHSNFICETTMGYLHEAVHDLREGSETLLDYLPPDHFDPQKMSKALRAVLVAGLSPNLALIDNKGVGWAHRNMKVFVHPGSVVSQLSHPPSLGSWVAYYQLQVTKVPYLYDCTVVDIAPCLLFAPSLRVLCKGPSKVLLQMGPWRLAVLRGVADLLIVLREQWSRFLNLCVGETLSHVHFQVTNALLALFGDQGNCPLLTKGDLLIKKHPSESPSSIISAVHSPQIKVKTENKEFEKDIPAAAAAVAFLSSAFPSDCFLTATSDVVAKPLLTDERFVNNKSSIKQEPGVQAQLDMSNWRGSDGSFLPMHKQQAEGGPTIKGPKTPPRRPAKSSDERLPELELVPELEQVPERFSRSGTHSAAVRPRISTFALSCLKATHKKSSADSSSFSSLSSSRQLIGSASTSLSSSSRTLTSTSHSTSSSISSRASSSSATLSLPTSSRASSSSSDLRTLSFPLSRASSSSIPCASSSSSSSIPRASSSSSSALCASSPTLLPSTLRILSSSKLLASSSSSISRTPSSPSSFVITFPSEYPEKKSETNIRVPRKASLTSSSSLDTPNETRFLKAHKPFIEIKKRSSDTQVDEVRSTVRSPNGNAISQQDNIRYVGGSMNDRSKSSESSSQPQISSRCVVRREVAIGEGNFGRKIISLNNMSSRTIASSPPAHSRTLTLPSSRIVSLSRGSTVVLPSASASSIVVRPRASYAARSNDW